MTLRPLILVSLFACALLPLLDGCHTQECTAEFHPAVVLTVFDAATGARICDATVTGNGGHGTESFLRFAPIDATDAAVDADDDAGAPSTDCIYSGGAYPVSYVVTIVRSGFKTATITTAPPESGACGTITGTQASVSLTQ